MDETMWCIIVMSLDLTLPCFGLFYEGSLGARINELKQRVIAENPHRFAVAVPRELPNTYTYRPLTPHATETCHFHIACVPTDTTRPKKPHEKEGVEYHFVTKQQFDADALNNKYVHVDSEDTCTTRFTLRLTLLLHRFIEHGEYKENQYGTSIEAIRSVQAKNKMCVVDVQPEVGVTSRPLSASRSLLIQVYHNAPSSHVRALQAAAVC